MQRKFLSLPTPQHQYSQPGMEYLMEPRPISENIETRGSGKLQDRVAIITGGDSGIGRAVAYAFAKEGADIVIAYLNEHRDAQETKEHVEKLGRKCLLISGDLKKNPYPKKSSGRQSIVLEKRYSCQQPRCTIPPKASWIYQPNSLI